MALCNPRVSVHQASSPNVSWRKIWRPLSSRDFAFASIARSLAPTLGRTLDSGAAAPTATLDPATDDGSGFEEENAASVGTSAVTAAPVIATPSLSMTTLAATASRLHLTPPSAMGLNTRFAIANRMAGVAGNALTHRASQTWQSLSMLRPIVSTLRTPE